MKRMLVATVFLMTSMITVVQPTWVTMGVKTDPAGLSAPPGLELMSPARVSAQQTPKAPTYAEVAVIISKYHCTVCHGGTEPRAGLNLETRASLIKGGKDGPAVIPGQPGKSELILRLKGLSEPRMPYTGPPWLTDEEVGVIEQWIAAGATEGQ